MDDRPAIPAELRRRVLVEAGHRCAIPTCRHIEVDVHHIIPWAQCQTHEYHNLIALCPNCHRRAGRGEIDRKSQRLYKANLRFTHDKFSQLEVDVLFEAYRASSNEHVPWPPMNNIMLKRLFDSGFISIEQVNSRVSMNGVQISANELRITPKGRHFVDELGVTEL